MKSTDLLLCRCFTYVRGNKKKTSLVGKKKGKLLKKRLKPSTGNVVDLSGNIVKMQKHFQIVNFQRVIKMSYTALNTLLYLSPLRISTLTMFATENGITQDNNFSTFFSYSTKSTPFSLLLMSMKITWFTPSGLHYIAMKCTAIRHARTSYIALVNHLDGRGEIICLSYIFHSGEAIP